MQTERYDAILRAAERLFGEKGYHVVTIEEIARTAGVSKGLIIYHFASKEQLLEHLLKGEMAALSSRLDAIAQSDEAGRAKIRAAVETYFSVANSRPDLTQIALLDASLGEATRGLIIAFKEENLLRVAGLVEEVLPKENSDPSTADSLLPS